MKCYLRVAFFIIGLTFAVTGCGTGPVLKNVTPENFNPSIAQSINDFKIDFTYRKLKFDIPYGSKVDSIDADTVKKFIKIYLNDNFSFQPFRADNIKDIYSDVKKAFGEKFSNYNYTIYTLKLPLDELIPNFYRPDSAKYDHTRMPVQITEVNIPLVRNVSSESTPVNGLYGRNIALWPSHGWYYNNKENRWEWQRPRLFESVEDVLPLSFVVPYLIPMLENAGANVFDARERDIQKLSVVVDNDSPTDVRLKYYTEVSKNKKNKWKTSEPGFSVGNPPYTSGYNPFMKGTTSEITSDTLNSASVSWIPNIPETGEYAVYVSFNAGADNVTDAEYTVYHSGIKTVYKVNQQIGGGTWVYIGEFKFDKGYNPENDKVELTNKSSQPGKIISADAVRFGGGEGIIERGGTTSGRSKLFEAARYYLQYAGMPDTLVYNLDHDTSDYTDDYKSRAEYVNYLNGNPAGPNADRSSKGLGIPIDLSLALHTDAGIQHNDTTVGTLAIYSIPDFKMKDTFPDDISRLANRDLADILQTQIVGDIRAKYDSTWSRRQLKNADYSEAVRPNVPSALIELLAHQNFNDMKYALNPDFRFDVSRAIYKGILKFLSVQNKYPYVVEPLPVRDFNTDFDKDGNVVLRWKPVKDTLEPTAAPDKYIVYTRINNGDFDNGKVVDKPIAVFKNITPGVIYSYKVTAVNKGGESFPSEILSVCRQNNDKPLILIVNGFYRVAGPAVIEGNKQNGFFNTVDPGMPDKYDLSYTGNQYDFDSTQKFVSNDNPGWGASGSENEAQVIAGNTFDYPYVHGSAIADAGYSFVSSGSGAIEDSSFDIYKYKLIDLILGGQKSTEAPEGNTKLYNIFPLRLQKAIERYTGAGGNLFISGSYIGSDLFNYNKPDSTDIKFAENILKYKLDAGHASKNGKVYAVNSEIAGNIHSIMFNTSLNDSLYSISAPDAIQKINGSRVVLRYSENNFPAAVAYKGKYGVFAMGFPFETITDNSVRDNLMKNIVYFLIK